MQADAQITAGWLIDGSERPPGKDVIIKIKNGIISEIASKESNNKPSLPGQKSYDLSSCTILPCLIDSHVHLAWSGSDSSYRKNQFNCDFTSAKQIIEDNIERHFSRGVIAVRDAGDKNGHTLKYKNYHSSSKIHISSPGYGLHKPGRYGSIIGRAIKNRDDIIDVINNTKGIDHIKIINSGINSLTEFRKEMQPQFEISELEFIIQTAKNMNLPVMVHANGETPVREAIAAGCSSIEHGFYMGNDNLKRMAEKNIYWTPTAVTMQALSGHYPAESIESQTTMKILEHQIGQIYSAKKYGVKLTTGTDSGSLGVEHGNSLTDELALLTKAGYSVSEAVQCSTQNASSLLNSRWAGAIVPGKKANIIAFQGTPDMLIEGLNSIKHRFIDGILQ